MTARYFYTDPLAAAWMCQEHGMVFEDANGEPYGTPSMVPLHYKEPRPQKHVVRPLSLHLLQPKIGDMMEGGEIVEDEQLPYEEWADRYSIIQRDGKPFFWPECEAA